MKILLEIGILTGLVSGGLLSPALVSATERLQVNSNTEARLAGTDTQSGLRFSSSVSRDRRMVTVTLELLPTRIVAKLDDVRKTVVIRSVSAADGKLTQLSDYEVQALHDLAGVLADLRLATGGPVGYYLWRVLLLLLSYPPGIPIDLDTRTVAESKPLQWRLPRCARPGVTWTSLCDCVGTQIPAWYDDDEGLHADPRVWVGPCAEEPCNGRCGIGCGLPPFAHIKVFTQECLNHDQCCEKHGLPSEWVGPPCGDEFLAAAPGYIFAPDCAAISGNWQVTVRYTTGFQGLTDGGSWSDVIRFREAPSFPRDPLGSPIGWFTGSNGVDSYLGLRTGGTAVAGSWRYALFMDDEACGWLPLPPGDGMFWGENPDPPAVCGRFSLDFTGLWSWYWLYPECRFAGFGYGFGKVEGRKIPPGARPSAQTGLEERGAAAPRDRPGGLAAGKRRW